MSPCNPWLSCIGSNKWFVPTYFMKILAIHLTYQNESISVSPSHTSPDAQPEHVAPTSAYSIGSIVALAVKPPLPNTPTLLPSLPTHHPNTLLTDQLYSPTTLCRISGAIEQLARRWESASWFFVAASTQPYM